MIAAPGLLWVSLLASAVPPDPPRSLDLGVAASYSLHNNVGLRSGLGVQANVTHGWRVWQTRHGAGTMDLGVLVSYHADPYAFQNQHLGAASASGAAHRFEALVVLGHRMRLLRSRRLMLAFLVYGGWVHTWMRGRLENDALEIAGDYREDAGTFGTGGLVEIGVAVTDRVGLFTAIRAPFPYAPAPVTSSVFVSLGASVRFAGPRPGNDPRGAR